MLIIPYPDRLTQDWLRYKIRDNDLLVQGADDLDTPIALFVASLNNGSEVRHMLARCGFWIVNMGVKRIVFRASHPTVERWAKKFGAQAVPILPPPGHRMRFQLNPFSSFQWFDLCERVYLNSKTMKNLFLPEQPE